MSLCLPLTLLSNIWEWEPITSPRWHDPLVCRQDCQNPPPFSWQKKIELVANMIVVNLHASHSSVKKRTNQSPVVAPVEAWNLYHHAHHRHHYHHNHERSPEWDVRKCCQWGVAHLAPCTASAIAKEPPRSPDLDPHSSYISSLPSSLPLINDHHHQLKS